GVAAQRPRPRARRVDENAIDLADEALDALVALGRDLHRMDVVEAALGQPGLQGRETMPGDVERIEPAAAAHLGAERERLAAGAGAEVDDRLAAARADDEREQLAAFVLDLD